MLDIKASVMIAMEEIKLNKKLIGLFAISLVTLITSLDSSIVNIAAPIMAKDLAVSSSSIEWVISIYLMVIASLIMFFGHLGDVIGKVKVFQIGTIIFTIGSLFAGIQLGFGILLISRVVQAIGAAMTMSNNFGITTEIFSKEKRGLALSILTTFFAIGSIVGPSIGGFILSIGSWSYLFWINVPIGILSFVLGFMTLPREKNRHSKEKLDIAGVFIFTFLICLFFYSLMRIQTHGIMNSFFAFSLITIVVLFFIFIYREKSIQSPLLNLEIFENKNFTLGVVAAMLSFIVGFTASVTMPYYLINARNLNTGFAGILLIIIPITLATVGPIGGMLADKYGGEKISAIGLLSLIIAQTMIISFKLSTPYWFFIIMSLFYGIGMGLFQAPNNTVIMTAVDKKFLGVAGSVNSLARNLGMELGASLSTVTLYSVMSLKAGKRIINYPANNNQLFMFGFKAAFTLALVAAITAEAITLTRLVKHNKQKNITN